MVIARCVPADKRLAVLKAAFRRMPGSTYDLERLLRLWEESARLPGADDEPVEDRDFVCSEFGQEVYAEGAGLIVHTELSVATPTDLWLMPEVQYLARVQ